MGDLMSNLLQGAFRRLTAPILDDFKRVAGVEEALKDLQQALTQTRALLSDADQRRIDSEADRIWLRKLEAFAYDADDIVDEFYYSALRYRIEGGGKSGGAAPFDEGACRNRHGRVRTRDKMKRLFNAMIGNGTYKLRHSLAAKIEELTKEFKQVTGSYKELNTRALLTHGAAGDSSSPEGSTVRRETSSLVSEPYVFGRKDEVKQIVEILLHLDPGCDFQPVDSFLTSSSSVSSSSSFTADENILPVLPIIGIAGIGKTTVAQLVYNDDRVKKHFDLLMWVCVSNNFDLRRLTRQIYDYVATTEEKSVADSPNLDVIQTNLRHKLVGKRFLLVLDDVWSDARGEWHRLRASLLSGQQGSAVLVTTRRDSVAESIGTMDAVRLQGLSSEDCNELLLRCASVNRSTSKSYFSEDICMKLVEKIKGVPLAIKTLGNILSSKKVEHWEEILERDIWELQQSEGDILPVLKLSYEDLPPHLKRCFTYCSLFPEDFEFDKLKLVQLWMAQDFIQTQRPTDCLEDIGSSYFDELLNRSFFQKVDKHYTMHTLYHGLAQCVPNNRCVRITEKNSNHYVQDECLLHMSFSNPAVNLSISNHLRSLVFIREFSTTTDHFSHSLELTDAMLSLMKCLRVLDLSSSSITVLPESLGDLIHLRFLDISHTKVAALPNSLAQLYNLQCLELKHCQCLREIHIGVQSLLNLRHLNASDNLVNTLPGIGKLTSLQELRLFKVSKEEGHRISELKYLNELRNKLWIRDIQNIETKEEANHAELKNKKHLLELVLEWSANFASEIDWQNAVDEVELLQPPCNLKALSILGNGSPQPPSWLNIYNVSDLTSIWLRDCRNWNSFPPLGALRHLANLKIEYLLYVQEVGPQFYGKGTVAFPSLKALEFRHMLSLKKWVMPSERKVFPCLEKLVLEDCPWLESVPLPLTVQILKIEKCPKLQMDFKLLQNQPSLVSLSWSFENSYRNLHSCVTQTLQHLSSPKKLEFFFCDERETDKRWSQRPLWMPFSYSQGRASDELKHFSSGSLSIHDGSDIRLFFFYAYKYPEYPDVNCQDLCLRIRNYNGVEEYGYMSLSTCLRDRFDSVHQLSVKGCDKIEFLLGYGTISCLKSLQTLDIAECKGMMTLGWFPKHKFESLRLLKITNCPDLTTFPPLKLTMLEKLQIENSEGLIYMHVHGLVSLQCLEIAGCSRLEGGSIAGKLSRLEEMKLRRCSNLILTLNDLEGGLQGLTSLMMLEISSCQSLRELPTNLKVLTSLKKLMIMQCPEIRILPKSGLPRMLNELRIDGCPVLQQNCQTGGCEWHRVSYIKKRAISCPTCYPYKCSCS